MLSSAPAAVADMFWYQPPHSPENSCRVQLWIQLIASNRSSIHRHGYRDRSKASPSKWRGRSACEKTKARPASRRGIATPTRTTPDSAGGSRPRHHLKRATLVLSWDTTRPRPSILRTRWSPADSARDTTSSHVFPAVRRSVLYHARPRWIGHSRSRSP